MSDRHVEVVAPEMAKELLKEFPPYTRRLMPSEVYERWQASNEMPPHGLIGDGPEAITKPEAWFCHNYPMAECHRGAYVINDEAAVVFANDGYPDYNKAYLERWFAKQEIEIVGQTVVAGYTTLFLVEYPAQWVDDLDDAIWSAWYFRGHEYVGENNRQLAAAAYAELQQRVASEVMSRMGLEYGQGRQGKQLLT